MMLLLALACATDLSDTSNAGADDTAAADTADTDVGPSCAEDPSPPDTRDTGEAPHTAGTLTGAVTWTLLFDDEAHANGHVDCTYTRDYAQTEVGDQGYLCPECTLFTTGTAVMSEGFVECYEPIFGGEADRVEHLGIGEVDGVPTLFRSGRENLVLGALSPIVGDDTFDVAWEDEATLDSGGGMLLTAAGTLTLGVDESVLVDDVTGARTEPYTCGWPQNSPGGPNLSWDVADGAVFPNIRLTDQCGEPVDLWDFRGHYIVIDSSAPNCGPCQSMAAGAEAFKARIEAACAPVEMITLLNESLSAINKPASAEVVEDWVDEFGLESPVLADRGAGYALFPAYLGVEDGMSYPGVIVLDPEGRVLYGSTGFGTWDEFESVILDDWAARSE